MRRLVGSTQAQALILSANSFATLQLVYARKLVNDLTKPAEYLNAVHRLRVQLEYIMEQKLNERQDLDYEISIGQREIIAVLKKFKTK